MREMNPYLKLPGEQYWKTYEESLKGKECETKVWQCQYKITENTKIASFGSCFAQHISKSLKDNGYNWLCTEDLPQRVPDAVAKRFGYRVFTCRTGNVYTPKMLNQWLDSAIDGEHVSISPLKSRGRYLDPMRLAVEEEGFKSLDELYALRSYTLDCFYSAVRQADVFIFTLGLTESWRSKLTGEEYSICPMAFKLENFTDDVEFYNHDFESTENALFQSIEKLTSINPDIQIILTVSPVPLIATQTQQHVLVATSESKAILRSACGSAKRSFKNVDYFPSYEIVTNPYDSYDYFDKSRRQVSPDGVARVMSQFLAGTGGMVTNLKGRASRLDNHAEEFDQRVEEVCDEELLVAFGREKV